MSALPAGGVIDQYTVAAAFVLGQRLVDLLPHRVTVPDAVAQTQHLFVADYGADQVNEGWLFEIQLGDRF